MELITIDQFTNGAKIEGFYLIKSCQCKTAANNNKYLDLTLSDQTGEINAKLWEYSEEDGKSYESSTLIKIRGTVSEWQGQLQLKIERIRLCTPDDGVDPANFVPVAPYTPEYMFNHILNFITKMQDPDIKAIVQYIFKENKQKLMTFPAAMKNHHAIRSGLLYHTMTMLMLAEKLSSVYDFINTDLLYGGVILHDMAKIEEMDANELGIVSDYTVEGQLLGHIIQGIKNVDRVAKKVGANEEASLLLQHMILSHHYEPEFGSPKRPMIPEAELLHYLDIIDSRMYDMKRVLQNTPEGGFSEKLWSMHNRKLYKAFSNSQELDDKSLA